MLNCVSHPTLVLIFLDNREKGVGSGEMTKQVYCSKPRREKNPCKIGKYPASSWNQLFDQHSPHHVTQEHHKPVKNCPVPDDLPWVKVVNPENHYEDSACHREE